MYSLSLAVLSVLLVSWSAGLVSAGTIPNTGGGDGGGRGGKEATGTLVVKLSKGQQTAGTEPVQQAAEETLDTATEAATTTTTTTRAVTTRTVTVIEAVRTTQTVTIAGVTSTVTAATTETVTPMQVTAAAVVATVITHASEGGVTPAGTVETGRISESEAEGNEEVAAEIADTREEEGENKVILLDLDQVFIPTLSPPEADEDEGPDIGRIDLRPEDLLDHAPSPSLHTIGTEIPWEVLLGGDDTLVGQEEGETTKGKKEGGGKRKKKSPYGTWKSPFSSEWATRTLNKIAEPPKVDPVTGNVFWAEELSEEDGRKVVFHFDPETRQVVRWTPFGWDVQTRIHEYGGGAFTVYNDTLFFSNAADNSIYKQYGPVGEPERLTNVSYRRYADASYSPQLNALFVVVEDNELQQKGEASEPEGGIVKVDVVTGEERVVAAHADFFSSPRVSHDGRLLVWIQWTHPRMPWDETRMFVGEIKNSLGKVAIVKYFQHGSMMTPSFDQNNQLYYVHDSTGWWNLYQVNRRNFEINLTPQSKEVGWPMWRFGLQAYDVNPRLGANEAVVICGSDLTIVDTLGGDRRVVDTGYTSYSHGVVYSLDGSKVYTVAGGGLRGPQLVEVDVTTGETVPLRDPSRGTSTEVDPGYVSIARQIQFPTTAGDFAYGYLYLPKNKEYHAPQDTRPPLLLKAHGGPTAAASKVFNPEYQFFTSRGFAILDVDYRGSTGYGTLYRNKLHEMWGVYDVDDVLAGAEYLVGAGLVNPEQLCIDGSSAGGYTTLSALSLPGSSIRAGASYYGISDLAMLARDTHKFESRYMDQLVGDMDTHADRYMSRSPIANHDTLDVPIIFFHGTEDKVVPPNQALEMYQLLKDKGLPTALLLFQDETHGFVRPENRIAALDAEIFFFSQIFNFTLADVTSDVKIENLEAWRNGDVATTDKVEELEVTTVVPQDRGGEGDEGVKEEEIKRKVNMGS